MRITHRGSFWRQTRKSTVDIGGRSPCSEALACGDPRAEGDSSVRKERRRGIAGSAQCGVGSTRNPQKGERETAATSAAPPPHPPPRCRFFLFFFVCFACFSFLVLLAGFSFLVLLAGFSFLVILCLLWLLFFSCYSLFALVAFLVLLAGFSFLVILCLLWLLFLFFLLAFLFLLFLLAFLFLFFLLAFSFLVILACFSFLLIADALFAERRVLCPQLRWRLQAVAQAVKLGETWNCG